MRLMMMFVAFSLFTSTLLFSIESSREGGV